MWARVYAIHFGTLLLVLPTLRRVASRANVALQVALSTSAGKLKVQLIICSLMTAGYQMDR